MSEPVKGRTHSSRPQAEGGVWGSYVEYLAALEILQRRVDAVFAYIGEMGCFCPSDDVHASLPDHEVSCFAQIEHLLTTGGTE